MIIVITGGSSSGKSKVAEDMMNKLEPGRKLYIATMQISDTDEDGKKRIEKHRERRKGSNYITIEKGKDLQEIGGDVAGGEQAGTSAEFTGGERAGAEDQGAGGAGGGRADGEGKSALLECISNLTANVMFSERVLSSDETVLEVISEVKDLSAKMDNLVIVTNNIFDDIDNYDDMTSSYVKALGEINQELVRMADEAYEVVVGIPVRIK